MNTHPELYLHIPFCARKCAYCDFFSGAFSDAEIRQYFEDLRREIRNFPEEFAVGAEHGQEIRQAADSIFSAPVGSIFIGGGTPSVVPAEEIAETVDTLRGRFDIPSGIEFTLEANPGTLTREKLRVYRESGVSRLSLGLQSPDDRMLQKLGRIHTFEKFLESYELAREEGFENTNVDLMSGLPGETPQDFEKGLFQLISLQPAHISVYSLIIEENTPFYALYGQEGERRNELPGEESDRVIYHRTREILESAGYHRYEISNYALPGKECAHNIGYWTGTPYIGFGAAAASYIPVVRKTTADAQLPASGILAAGIPAAYRIKNASSLRWLSQQPAEEETLDCNDLMSEAAILGLRMERGVSEAEFRERFGRTFEECFPEAVKRHLSAGTLVHAEGRYFLSEYGFDVANVVMADFL